MLHSACATKNAEVVQLILFSYQSKLLDALNKNDQERSLLMDKIGAFKEVFRCLDDNGFGVIHHCAKNGHLNLIRQLCRTYPSLIDISLKTANGYTIIDYAAEQGHVNLLEWLHMEYPDFFKKHISKVDDIPNKHNRTVLHMASFQGRLDVIKWLCRRFGDLVTTMLNCKDTDRDNVVHKATIGGHLHVLKFYYNNFRTSFFDFMEAGHKGKLLFHVAATFGHLEVLKWLYSKFAHSHNFCEATPEERNNALHFACRKGHIRVAGWLFKTFEIFCENINQANHKNNTALSLAVRGGHLKMLKYLHKKFGLVALDYNVVSSYKWTVFHYAARFDHVTVLKFLRSIWSPDDLPRVLFQMTKLRTDSIGYSVFHVAVVGGHLEVVQWILEAFPELSDQILDQKAGQGQNTSLNLATMYGHLHMVKFFCENYPEKFSCYDRNRRGWTPLLSGAFNGRLLILQWWHKMLGSDNFDVGHTNDHGQNMLHLATRAGHLRIAKWLLSTFGPDKCGLLIVDTYNCNIIDMAVQEEQYHMLEYFQCNHKHMLAKLLAT